MRCANVMLDGEENEHLVAVERRATIQGSAERPDIRIDDRRAPRVAIECAFGGDNDRDALARLGPDGEFDTAIAVNIPRSFEAMTEQEATKALKGGATVGYAVLQHGFRFPTSGFIEGTPQDLAAIIPFASVTKERVEAVADEVAKRIDSAADALADGMASNDWEQIAQTVYQRSVLTGFRTVMILWFDAMLVQSHLRASGQPFDELPLPQELIPSELAATWQRIMETNWRSIFAPAVEVLENSTRKTRGATSDALRILLEAVEVLESSQLRDHFNVGAELFPKISEDRKTAAAFYTTAATAELLAALTIRPDDRHEWADETLFQRLRIADLACGTGALLRAAYRRVRSLHEAGGGGTQSTAMLHKDAMERGVKGADVSPIAAHLTNSSLAVMGRGEPYGKTHIGWLAVGAPASNNQRTTGSLEFLKGSVVEDLFDEMGATTGGDDDERSPIVVFDSTLDYALMNPPYSRTRGGQSAFDIAGLTDAERAACQRRWGSLIKNQPAIKTAGMAASFLCLAHKKLKPGGRMGFVLPLTAAFAETWTETRAMIVKEFADVVAVSKAGTSEGKDALSADTHLGEMLLVATRKPRNPPPPPPPPPRGRRKTQQPTPIRCVTLRRIPVRQGEAGEFGRGIQSALNAMRAGTGAHPIVVGGEELGQIATFDPVAGEPWSHLGVLHADLAMMAKRIADDGVLPDIDGGRTMRFRCPMTTLAALFDIGPTHHLIGHLPGNEPIGAFLFHPITRKSDVRGSHRALWSADRKTLIRLVVDPTHKGRVVNRKQAARIKAKAGALHYARGIRWTSQPLLAASTEHKVFGGRAWTTLMHGDDHVHKAFALWANSTLGLITHWTRAGRAQRGRANTQVRAIHAMPCPNLSELDGGRLAGAAAAFEDLRTLPLRPACQAHADENRLRIDDAVVDVLGLPARRARESVGALRDQWCAEPTVHGDNQEAWRLLAERKLVDERG